MYTHSPLLIASSKDLQLLVLWLRFLDIWGSHSDHQSTFLKQLKCKTRWVLRRQKSQSRVEQDGSVGERFALQALWPEFDSQSPQWKEITDYWKLYLVLRHVYSLSLPLKMNKTIKTNKKLNLKTSRAMVTTVHGKFIGWEIAIKMSFVYNILIPSGNCGAGPTSWRLYIGSWSGTVLQPSS